jgi:hypothetical protein
MASVKRVNEVVREIDRPENDHGAFVSEAVRRELDRRRRVELRRSLRHPHPECARLADQGIEQWARGLPEEDAGALVGSSAGRAVRWVPGEGWAEDGREAFVTPI